MNRPDPKDASVRYPVGDSDALGVLRGAPRTKEAETRWPKGRSNIVTVSIVAMVLVVALGVVAAVKWGTDLHKWHIQEQELSELPILEEQVEALRSGKRDSLFFYCTVNTDSLVKKLELDRLGGLKQVRLEMTDISSDGMIRIGKVSSLRELIVDGPLNDEAIDGLVGNADIEKLSLINTRVSDRSLAQLKSLTHLKELTVYCFSRDPDRRPCTADGLKRIADIPSLEKL